MRRRLAAFVVLVALSGPGACSKSSAPSRNPDPSIVIVVTDSAFALPDTLHAGLNHFIFENRGRDIHECMFIRLPDGMSPDDYIAHVKSGIAFPAGAVDCAGPGLTSPGEREEIWVPLEEGMYITGCWLTKHMTTRPPARFVVVGAPARPVEAPQEDVTVRMLDFRFEFVGTLKRGEQVIRYETIGPSMHEVDIVRLEDGRTVDDVRAWFKDQTLALPGIIGGGSMDSHDLKRVTWVRRTFRPGRYVFWCDMPMIQNSEKEDSTAAHVTHADAGMFAEVTVD